MSNRYSSIFKAIGRLAFLFLVFSAGCSKTPEETASSEINLSPSEIADVPYAGGTYTLHVECNGSWTAVRPPTWIKVRPASARSNATVEITVSPNDGPARSWPLVFENAAENGKTLSVSQATAGEPTLVLSKSSGLNSEGEEITLTVETELSWEITSYPEWCIPEEVSGRGNAVISLVVIPNDLGEERCGTIGFTSGKYTKTLTISQDRMTFLSAELSISGLASSAGQTVTLSVASNVEWEITGFPQWCVPAQTEGSGDAQVDLTFADNLEGDQRSHTFQVRQRGGSASYGVEVTQYGGRYAFKLSLSGSYSAGEGAYAVFDDGIKRPLIVTGSMGVVDLSKEESGKIVNEIKLDEGSSPPIFIGRRTDETVKLAFESTNQLGVRKDAAGNILVNTVQELLMVDDYPYADYLQESDLDMGMLTDFSSLCQQLGFEGTYDGAGYGIYNFHPFASDHLSMVGLFAMSSGVIKNVNIKSGLIEGYAYIAAAIVCSLSDGVVESCANWAPICVEGDDVGGIVGIQRGGEVIDCTNFGGIESGGMGAGIVVRNYGGKVTSCTNNGSVVGKWAVGGIAGECIGQGTAVSGCTNTAAVSVNKGDFSYHNPGVGGIAGYAEDASFTDCMNGGRIESATYANDGSLYRSGGIVGHGYRTAVKSCTNTGNIYAYSGPKGSNGNGWYAGGVAGSLTDKSSVELCKNSGKLSGSGFYHGGIVGAVDKGTDILSSHNSGELSGSGFYHGGIVGAVDKGTDILSSHNSGELSSSGEYHGGIVGAADEGTDILSSHNSGELSGSGEYHGGIVGAADEGTDIRSSHNSGHITGTGGFHGGIAGLLSGSARVTACKNSGVLIGNGQCHGGIAGASLRGGNIRSSYNIGDIESAGNYHGGIIGRSEGTIRSCYSVAAISGSGDAIGAVVGEGGIREMNYWLGAPEKGVGLGADNTYRFRDGFMGWPEPHFSGWETPEPWKSLGGYTDGPDGLPLFPTLYWE